MSRAKGKIPKEIPLSKVRKMLIRSGAVFERQTGNHQRWTRVVRGRTHLTILQADDPVRKDVYEAVSRQLRISKKEWKRLHEDKNTSSLQR